MNEEEMRKASKFFKDNSKLVHIEAIEKENSVRFYNGYITEIRPDFLILNDRKLGEMPIFFSHIKVIEPFNLKHEQEFKAWLLD